jgi:hypothetical protein
MAKSKDSFCAKVSFYLSLGFWIPMFNIAMCILSLYYAAKALKLRHNEPDKYDGFVYAIIALVLSVSSLIMTVFGVIVYFKKKACGCAVPAIL